MSTGGTGAGIIDFIYHPPLSFLQRSTTFPTVIPNPLSLGGSLTAHSGGLIPRYAYGFRWAVNTAPAGAGRTTRTINVFEERWFAFALHYRTADGNDFIADEVQTGLAEGFWLWAVSLPQTLQYDILPGWTAHLDWFIGA